MSRGFNVSVRATTPDDINEGSLAAELASQGQLSALEPGYLAYAMTAAKALATALGNGPFLVTLTGVDHMSEPGESSSIAVSVETRFTFASSPEPATIVSPESSTTVVSAEPGDTAAPVEVIAATENQTAAVVEDSPLVEGVQTESPEQPQGV